MAKETVIKMKRKLAVQNIFADDTSDKGLLSKICEELIDITQNQEDKQSNQKMGRRHKQPPLQGEHTEFPQACENMFHITSHQRCKLNPQ